MTQSLIPRRGVYISSGILFHPDMSGPVAHTLMQLIALCSSNRARMTAPLSFHTLSGLTRKSVRTLYGHFSVLQNNYAALRLQTAGDGIFVVVLADWVFPPVPPGRKKLQTRVKEEEELSLDESGENLVLLLNDSDLEGGTGGKPRRIAKFDKRKPGKKTIRKLSAEFCKEILAAGVFKSLLNELAVSPYSEDEMRSLLAWTREKEPERPAGLFIARVRARANPPEGYLQPPCPHCGWRGGKHAPDCRGRYISGEFADLVEH